MLNFPVFPPLNFIHFYREFILYPLSHVEIGQTRESGGMSVADSGVPKAQDFRTTQRMGRFNKIKKKKNLFILCCSQSFSHIPLFTTPQTAAHQAPLRMEFSRQEYLIGLPFSSPGDLTNPVIEPMSPESPAFAGRFFTTEPPGKNPFFVLGYSQLTMLSQFQVNSKGTQPDIYMYSFPAKSPPIQATTYH